jgi:peptidoglycan/xylan/chitin deacetylase (PgdA/CDA1 family)
MFSSNSIAILAYHSLDDSRSVLSTPPRTFADQMLILHELGIRVVPLGEVGNVLKTGDLTGPLVAITFDDGFRSVYDLGFPILQRYGFPATVFLVTDYCGKANCWPTQPSHIKRGSLLGWTEIREMSTQGIIFGSHTRTHRDLTTLSVHEAERELMTSKRAIEDGVGYPVGTFAYPYGAYNNRIRQLVESHFAVACSTELGFVQSGSDLFALERLDMYYLRHTSLFHRLFSRKIDMYIRFRRTARDMRKRIRFGELALLHCD